jgi:hypothetical protein
VDGKHVSEDRALEVGNVCSTALICYLVSHMGICQNMVFTFILLLLLGTTYDLGLEWTAQSHYLSSFSEMKPLLLNFCQVNS